MINLKFETISPVHISNGLELSNNLDYVTEGNLLNKLNLFKTSEKLIGLHQFSFEKSYSLKEINKIISENIGRFGKEDFIYSVGIDSNMEKLIQSPNTEGQSYVKEFINTNGNFYIPASSVKGSLLTILHATKLGIDNSAADIKDKFVFCDSGYLDENLFEVIRFDRPPQVNLLCLKKGSQFKMTIRKKGNFDTSIFKSKLRKYTTIEIAKAKKSIEKWETEKNKESLGSKFFKNALNSLTEVLNSIKDDEYLINLGFGGGTFFKIYDNLETIPKNRKGEDIHTTFSSLIEKERFHIGWCKLKIN